MQTWFKSDESRNIQWGLLALDAVVRDDAEQKKLMSAVISNYAKIILASKALGTGQITNGGTGTGLGNAENIWTTNNFDVGISWLIGAAGLPVAYDLLFNDMTPAQRTAVHDALAAATAGRRPWGSDNPLGRAVSNWYGYHGELAVMLAAIEGEPGYDAATYPPHRDHPARLFRGRLHARGRVPRGFLRAEPRFPGGRLRLPRPGAARP